MCICFSVHMVHRKDGLCTTFGIQVQLLQCVLTDLPTIGPGVLVSSSNV